MEFYENPKFQAQQKHIQAFCDLFTQLDGTYEEKIQALIATIHQNSFEPGGAAMIVDELHAAIAMMRSTILQEPHASGFYTQAEIDEGQKQPNVAKIEIIASKHAIKIAREVYKPAPGKDVYAFVWFKKEGARP